VARPALILLDTHVAVWFAAGIELKPRIVALIGEAAQQNSVFLSAISAWEIGVLVAKGRLVLAGSAEAYVPDLYSREGVVEEPVTSTIAELSSRLPGDFHGDPADRIIVASAALRSATLVTRDDRILSYARKTGLVKIASC
jgi:PIN domain nuclease of toxin-antitoxin system